MANTVGWAEFMYVGTSAIGIDKEPQHLNNIWIGLFYVSFIIVGSFFMLNLFVGVVISTYNKEKERLGKDILLTDE